MNYSLPRHRRRPPILLGLGLALLARLIPACAAAGDPPVESGATVGSTFYAWGAQIDEPNKTGSVRWIVNAPTATLDRLIVHMKRSC